MNRRSFLKTIAGGALAFAVPEIIVPERTVWALDSTMIKPTGTITESWDTRWAQVDDPLHTFMQMIEPTETPFLDRIEFVEGSVLDTLPLVEVGDWNYDAATRTVRWVGPEHIHTWSYVQDQMR